jgi:tetratricopeptide (TPR) repeat protein
MSIPIHRRFIIVLICLGLSAFLFRGSVAVALISRGDGYLQKGRPETARVYYARALFFDGVSSLAADRYAFSGLEIRTPQALNSSIVVTSRALAQTPNDLRLLQDRALLYQAAHRYRQAYADFRRAAALTHDARWRHLATRAAYHAERKPH